jgi:ADP-ribose pyrophosphatase
MARMVELIVREIPFKGYFQVSRYHLRHTQFNGGMGPQISRVVPYDPIRDEIALIEQFRPGAYAAGDPDPWLIEVVAGIIDANETLEDVARRESLEETGLTISALDYLGKHYMTPGGSSESIAMYAGCADFTQLGGLHGMADEGEDIRVFAVPAGEAIAMVHDNRIRNAMTALALLLFESRRQVLRQDWQ